MIPVTRHVAGPGAGKTHTLLELVRQEAEEHGTGIGDLLFTTFSRSMAGEIADRIRTVYPTAAPTDIQTAVCTLHAAALRACKAEGLIDTRDGDQIIQEGPKTGAAFVDFAAYNRLPYDPKIARSAPDDDRPVVDVPGNTFFRLARYVVGQHTWTWTDAPHAEAALGVHLSRDYGDPADLLEEWADYKAENRLFEHDDYVALAIEEEAEPAGSVLTVDEFQDLSPLQFALFERWRVGRTFDRVYVAGDPNQAIHGYRGANPALLEHLPGPVEDIGAPVALPVSHRCPPAIVAVADLVLGRPSNMLPRPGSVGRVEIARPHDDPSFVALVEDLAREHGRVLVLTRYRRSVGSLSRILTTAGVPHRALLSDWSTGWETVRTAGAWRPVDTPSLLSALDAIAAFEAGSGPGVLTKAEAGALAIAVPRLSAGSQGGRSARVRPTTETVLIADILGRFGLTRRPGAAREIVRALDLREPMRGGIRAALARGLSRPDMSAIAVGTIHSAKGLEAPAVLLHTAFNEGRAAEYDHKPAMAAEERRVYYVGCTRASDRLVILDSLRSGPSAPPLRAIPGVSG